LRGLRSASSIGEVGEEERPLTWDEANALIRLVMRIDEKLDRILEYVEGENGEEEEESDT
jgi:hypothetical protein